MNAVAAQIKAVIKRIRITSWHRALKRSGDAAYRSRHQVRLQRLFFRSRPNDVTELHPLLASLHRRLQSITVNCRCGGKTNGKRMSAAGKGSVVMIVNDEKIGKKGESGNERRKETVRPADEKKKEIHNEEKTGGWGRRGRRDGQKRRRSGIDGLSFHDSPPPESKANTSIFSGTCTRRTPA